MRVPSEPRAHGGMRRYRSHFGFRGLARFRNCARHIGTRSGLLLRGGRVAGWCLPLWLSYRIKAHAGAWLKVLSIHSAPTTFGTLASATAASAPRRTCRGELALVFRAPALFGASASRQACGCRGVGDPPLGARRPSGRRKGSTGARGVEVGGAPTATVACRGIRQRNCSRQRKGSVLQFTTIEVRCAGTFSVQTLKMARG